MLGYTSGCAGVHEWLYWVHEWVCWVHKGVCWDIQVGVLGYMSGCAGIPLHTKHNKKQCGNNIGIDVHCIDRMG